MSEVKFKPSIERSSNSENSTRYMHSQDDILYNDFINIKNRINFHGYGELCKYVENNIYNLLSSSVDKKAKALKVITDKDFLVAMDIANLSLPKEYINRFNRVYRAYIVNPEQNVIYNKESADLLYKLAFKLNNKLVNILINIGIAEKDAIWLTVNRYSSTDERRNIRRMVRAMQHMDPYIMTEQMVVNIFAKTFNDQLTNLFCAIMTDRFDTFDSEDEQYVYSTVSNALLDILRTMDIDEIKDIILEYQDEINKSGTRGRFYLSSINSEDYGIICQAIEELEAMGIKIS